MNNGIKTRLTGTSNVADGLRLNIAAHRFPTTSASRRFYVVSTPVTWDCDPGTQLLTRRWGYPLSALQPAAFGAANSAPLANRVTSCAIRYTPAGSSGRGGVVQVQVRISVPGDTAVPETAELNASYFVSEGP